jgi:hypothetical protein
MLLQLHSNHPLRDDLNEAVMSIKKWQNAKRAEVTRREMSVNRTDSQKSAARLLVGEELQKITTHF